MTTHLEKVGVQVPPFSTSNSSRVENVGSNSARCSTANLSSPHLSPISPRPASPKENLSVRQVSQAIEEPVYSTPISRMEKRNMKNEKINDDDVLVRIEHTHPGPSNDKTNSRPCRLEYPSIDRVVASGKVYDLGGSNIIHYTTMGEGNVRVSVLNDEYRDEPLPTPTIEAETLIEAVGGFVEWPRHLVIVTDPIVVKDPVVKAAPKEGEFEQLVKSFARLVDLATNKNSKIAVSVVVDPDVFRMNDHNSKPVSEILVVRDDLLHLINFTEIGLPIMQLYMCTLYNRAKELGVADSIRFAIPAGACGKHGKSNSEDLYSIMETASVDCIFLYPYNIGYHWVLAVVKPGKRQMWYFDPLDNTIPPKLLETLKFAFKSLDYSENFGSSRRPAPVFDRAMCPKQTGTVECGYYVMRFMKDIIESYGTHPSSLFLSCTPYKIDLIDAVRAELMSFIRDNMYVIDAHHFLNSMANQKHTSLA